MISVIIPALKEAAVIGATLVALLRLPGDLEILLVDGSSDDATAEIARSYQRVRVVVSERGRGTQLREGARVSTGDILWFLHADTIVPPEAADQIHKTLEDPKIAGGNFALQFDGQSRGARLLTAIYPHLRKLGLCYGDSGIFTRRTNYELAGGFRAHPIFEDLDLVSRLRKTGRFVQAPGPLITSSRRFEHRNFELMFAHWTALQALYWAGVPPRILSRLYPSRKS